MMNNCIISAAVILFVYFAFMNKRKEHFCALQHGVCDHFCQKAKLELCQIYKKHNLKFSGC